MARTFTEADVGKPVIADGQRVGVLASVEAGRGHVELDQSLPESLAAKLGWADADAGTHPVDEDAVAAVTDDEIRVATPF